MRHGLFIGIALLAFIALGIAFSATHLPDAKVISSAPRVATSTPPRSFLASFSSRYRRGVYTLSGSIVTPTPCYAVTAETALVPSTTPSQIKLSLSALSGTGICLELPATTTFETTQKAPQHSVIAVYLNNVLATSTGTTTTAR